MKISEPKGNWTRFWKYLNVELGREERWIEDEIYKKDFRRLKRLGIDLIALDRVKREFQKYNGGYIQFHRFAYFFAKDPDTVRRWTKTRDVSKAILKLCYKITKNKRAVAKSILYELLLLMELFRKREIIQYSAKFSGNLSTSSLSNRSVLSTMRIGERNAGFRIEKKFNYDKFTVYCLSKKNGSNQKVYKFVLLKKFRNSLYINTALDTAEERNKILGHISKKLQIPINRLKEEPDITSFIEFLKNGFLASFTLVGIDFINQGYKISISPQYSKPLNVTDNPYYKELLPSSNIEILESIQRIKILNLTLDNSFQVNINFLNYKNEDIIGGMRLSLNAQGLNLSKRVFLKEAFRQNFGFQLDTPLIFEVEEKEIYKKFLHNPPKKRKKIEIVSNKSIEISHKLSECNLLPQPKQLEETAKICTFHGCSLKFRPQWTTGRICKCGYNLWENGSTIITQVIDEKRVRDFFKKIAEELGYVTTPLFRDLIKRKIFPIEIIKDDKAICPIPITTPLKDQQLEVLKYRYPNLVLVTSRDDKDTLTAKGFMTEELYSLVYELFENSKSKIDSLLNEITINKSIKLSTLALTSSKRIIDEKWYISQGTIGAEFFEADISMLLNYIFKNSIWLGAKTRGKSLPDSLSAFPIEDKKRGCFISDVKFTQKNNPDIGPLDKNKKYLKDGKNNPSIKYNGGLRGFVFVSNKPAPNNFTNKMLKIIGRKSIKGGYLTNSQILKIYNHLKHWENDFDIDRRKRNIFINSMEEIFLNLPSLKNKDKIKIWKDVEIKNILDNNCVTYGKLSPTRLSVNH